MLPLGESSHNPGRILCDSACQLLFEDSSIRVRVVKIAAEPLSAFANSRGVLPVPRAQRGMRKLPGDSLHSSDAAKDGPQDNTVLQS